MKSYRVINGRNFRQEWYDGMTADGSTRAKELRKLGYKVALSAKENQVTRVGLCKMQMLSILNPDDNIPNVEVERI